MAGNTPQQTPRVIDDDEPFQLRVVAANDDKLWWQVTCSLNDKVNVAKARLTKGSGAYVHGIFLDGRQLHGNKTLREEGVTKLSVLATGATNSALYAKGSRDRASKRNNGSSPERRTQKSTKGWNVAQINSISVHKDNCKADPRELTMGLHKPIPAGVLEADRHIYSNRDPNSTALVDLRRKVRKERGGDARFANSATVASAPHASGAGARAVRAATAAFAGMPDNMQRAAARQMMGSVVRPQTAPNSKVVRGVGDLRKAVRGEQQLAQQEQTVTPPPELPGPKWRHIRTPSVPLETQMFVDPPMRTNADGSFVHQPRLPEDSKVSGSYYTSLPDKAAPVAAVQSQYPSDRAAAVAAGQAAPPAAPSTPPPASVVQSLVQQQATSPARHVLTPKRDMYETKPSAPYQPRLLQYDADQSAVNASGTAAYEQWVKGQQVQASLQSQMVASSTSAALPPANQQYPLATAAPVVPQPSTVPVGQPTIVSAATGEYYSGSPKPYLSASLTGISAAAPPVQPAAPQPSQPAPPLSTWQQPQPAAPVAPSAIPAPLQPQQLALERYQTVSSVATGAPLELSGSAWRPMSAPAGGYYSAAGTPSYQPVSMDTPMVNVASPAYTPAVAAGRY